MAYQNMVNSLTGAMGPTQGAYPNYANAGNLDNNPFVDLSSQPLEYRSYVSHDGNIGYVPAYMFGSRKRRSGRKARNAHKGRKGSKRARKGSKRARKGSKRSRKARRSAKPSKKSRHRFGCDTCGSAKSGFGCGCNSGDDDKQAFGKSHGFGSPICGSVCGM